MLPTSRIATSRVLASNGASQYLTKAFVVTYTQTAIVPATTSAPRLLVHTRHNGSPAQRRSFHNTAVRPMKEFFPAPESPHIKTTKPAWPHPIYTEEQIKSIKVAHRECETWSDWVAIGAVRTLRWFLDRATGYKHEDPEKHVPGTPFAMNERKYMIRNIFLESVAGVPGMVGGMLRHLHSMRRMKRDNGWIETLLEESYNERMHLLTFLKMAEPGLFMRLMVLGAQGVFFNAFFVSYLISPRTCHRFVGFLEEEAVLTYTREIADLDAGHLPTWEGMAAPDIAVAYWNMPEGKRTMRDLLLYIRADEAKHREVNHTLGNLDQKRDPNPFVSEYKDDARPHPGKSIEHVKAKGWERDEVI